MRQIDRIHSNESIVCEKFNVGSDGFIHAKNGSTTEASIPIGNVDIIRRIGGRP